MRRLKVSTLILVVSFSFAWSQTAPEFGQIWHKQGTGPLIHVQGDSGSWNGGDIAFDWSFGHVLQDNDTLKLYIGAFDGTVYSIGMYYSMNIDSGWVEHPSNPIMSGTPSAWDSVNVGGPMVIKQNGEYKMWYMGNGSHGTYASRVLGYATSSNGVNWDKHPSPVIDSEDFPDGVAAWVRNPFVISEPDTLKMWFCTSPGFADDEDIHYAWSLDGIDWVIPSTEPVIPAPRNRWVEFPCVKKIDGKYVMWFGEGLYGDSYKFRTKTAISTDGINWRYDNLFNPLLMPGSLGEYDEDGVAILDVIEDGGVSWALTGSWRVAGEYTDIGLAKYNPTIVPSGDVSGTWTKAGSPIRVQGEITIPNGETLTIEPGTTVEFLGHHQLNVQGRILAQGTEADPIFFMVDDTLEFSDNASSEGVWGGIRFDSTPVDNDSSYFQHCEIAYAKTFAGNAGGLDGKVGGGMLINYFSKVRVESCVIQHNRAIGDMSGTDTYGAGICVMNNSNPEIINNLIQFNTTVHLINNKGAHGGGILIGWNSDPKIVGNTFRRNRNSDVGAGIAIWGNCYPLIQNNLIVENVSIGNNGTQGYGGGVGIGGASRPIFINNTIANNIAGWKGGGFYSNGGEAVFINTIIANNHLTDNSAAPSEQIGTYYMNGLALEFYNSCLEDGEAGIDWGINANEVGDVVFENSIEVDPGLIGNYTLSPFVSQCFGAGTTSCIVDGVTYNALPQDINGHACPDPPGSQPDMGAIESNRSGHYISGGWNWWQPHGNPVFLPGAAGTYDDVSLIAPDVLFHDGQYHMWYGGYDGNRIRICQATSADGVEWVKNSANPILTGDPDTWQGSSLNLPRVIIVDEVYHMWFSTNDRVGHATSTDGLEWTFTGSPVLEGTLGSWDGDEVHIAEVIYRDSLFHGWYTGINNDTWAIGYATSLDGIEWDKLVDPVFGPSGDGWDSGMFYASSVVWDGDYFYMWYSAKEDTDASRIGRAYSTNGINWTRASITGPEIDYGEPGSWNSAASFYPSALLHQGRYKIWFNGVPNVNHGWRVGYATLEPVATDPQYVEMPQSFMLSQNYPNPFNPMTHIRYSLPENGDIRLVIYDLLGREVVELVNDFRSVGNYETTWYGLDSRGNQVCTGVYFARLEAGRNVDVIKMLYLK